MFAVCCVCFFSDVFSHLSHLLVSNESSRTCFSFYTKLVSNRSFQFVYSHRFERINKQGRRAAKPRCSEADDRSLSHSLIFGNKFKAISLGTVILKHHKGTLQVL